MNVFLQTNQKIFNMNKLKCISVQGSRYGKSFNQAEEITHRDKNRLPIKQNRRLLKQIFLKGASNRVRSLNEEQAFAEMRSDREIQERIHNSNQKSTHESQNNFLKPSNQLIIGLIKFATFPFRIFQIVYNSVPIVTKNNKILYSKTPNKDRLSTSITSFHSFQPKQKTESISLQNAISFTNYAPIKMKTLSSKPTVPPQSPKFNMPATFQGTKKFLQSFL
ncbi:hypothetical protein pb186bvf_013798 [Paramecium bursaria]